MIALGQYNNLRIDRFLRHGAYLEDEEGNSVLLPLKHIPEEMDVDDEIRVFVYKDNEGRLVATTLTPAMTLHQAAYLKVNSVNNSGAFMSWGVEKDLFIPHKEMNQKMEEGHHYVVYLYVDEQTDRLVGSAKINRFLTNEVIPVEEGDEVDILIYERTDLGWNVIINQLNRGLLYENEVFRPIHVGEKTRGFIRQIREDDRIDVRLRSEGRNQTLTDVDKIRKSLEDHKGFLPLNDKTDPQVIYNELQMSKKAFKKAIGALYRDRVIEISENGISLK